MTKLSALILTIGLASYLIVLAVLAAAAAGY